jgi:hypothetical protein
LGRDLAIVPCWASAAHSGIDPILRGSMMMLDAVRELMELSNDDLLRWLELDEASLARGDAAARVQVLPDEGLDRLLLPIGRAHAELACLRDLVQRTEEKERDLRGRNLNQFVVNPRPFLTVSDHAPETLRILHELRTRAYGKVVLLRDADSGERRVLRIAQANLGFPEIGVLNRLAPLACNLVSASVGDEVTTPKATYKVIGVAHLERFFGSEISAHDDDFQRMDLEHERLADIAVLEGLARSVALCRDELRRVLLDGGPVGPIEEAEVREVQRGDAERLGAHFYTRTTKLQEELMLRPSWGVVIVTGVAGSGKTSVALGRTKVLCDRREEEEGEQEPAFFRSETSIGFVLNEQLRTYLERACTMLALFDMKVREYRDLREELLRTRNLDAADLERAVGATAHPLEMTMRWLRAVDATMAERFADTLEEAVARPPAERESVRKQVALRTDPQNRALEGIWGALQTRMAEVSAWLRRRERAPGVLRIEGLAARIDEARERFAQELETQSAWTGPAQRELRQNVRNALRERIVRALRLTDAYAAVLRTPALARELEMNGVTASDAAAVIAVATAPLRDKRLTDVAIDVILALAHAISIGYAGRQDRDPISHLAQPSFYSQVFIDEYQDFTEVQIHLMGLQADPRRRAVTMVGDSRQQLRLVRELDVAACFPRASTEELAPAMLLENKRQNGPLARLSQRFRETVLMDAPGASPVFASVGMLPRLVRIATEDLHDAIEAEIVRLPRDYSVAVICTSSDVAKQLERDLRDRLTSRFRETRFSTHTDLVRRFFVHFTTALDAKGLEFDAAIVPWVGRLDLADPIVANALYVAISRPRQRLSIVVPEDVYDPFARWIAEGMVEVVHGAGLDN